MVAMRYRTTLGSYGYSEIGASTELIVAASPTSAAMAATPRSRAARLSRVGLAYVLKQRREETGI
jgi:hypothetical protein